MPSSRRIGIAALVTTALGTTAAFAGRVAGQDMVARAERRLNPVGRRPPYDVSDAALELHRTLLVADLHADSLLWGRDLLVRSDRGCVDVPRLIEGGVALQAFSASVRVPRHLNLDRNADTSDDISLVALAGGWPPRTWRSPQARALYLASRARRMAAASGGRFTIVGSRPDLEAYLERRRDGSAITAGLLTLEGAAPLEGDPASIDRLADAGYRMLGLTHFVDNAFAGSAHGVDKGGLTRAGRELLRRAEARCVLIDLAHASSATVDEALAMATRPVVVSHGGLRSAHASIRNLPDDQVRGVAASGGVFGVGFWPAVTGGDDVTSIARVIVRAIEVAGIQHVGLGSDFDGAVPVPFDAAGLPLLTQALMAEGLAPEAIRAVMGGNVFRLLREALRKASDPPGSEAGPSPFRDHSRLC